MHPTDHDHPTPIVTSTDGNGQAPSEAAVRAEPAPLVDDDDVDCGDWNSLPRAEITSDDLPSPTEPSGTQPSDNSLLRPSPAPMWSLCVVAGAVIAGFVALAMVRGENQDGGEAAALSALNTLVWIAACFVHYLAEDPVAMHLESLKREVKVRKRRRSLMLLAERRLGRALGLRARLRNHSRISDDEQGAIGALGDTIDATRPPS